MTVELDSITWRNSQLPNIISAIYWYARELDLDSPITDGDADLPAALAAHRHLELQYLAKYHPKSLKYPL